MVAAAKAGRHSIGVEVDPVYCEMIQRRFEHEARTFSAKTQFSVVKTADLETVTIGTSGSLTGARAQAGVVAERSSAKYRGRR